MGDQPALAEQVVRIDDARAVVHELGDLDDAVDEDEGTDPPELGVQRVQQREREGRELCGRPRHVAKYNEIRLGRTAAAQDQPDWDPAVPHRSADRASYVHPRPAAAAQRSELGRKVAGQRPHRHPHRHQLVGTGPQQGAVLQILPMLGPDALPLAQAARQHVCESPAHLFHRSPGLGSADAPVEVTTVGVGLEVAPVEVCHVHPPQDPLGVMPGRSAITFVARKAADRLVEGVLDVLRVVRAQRPNNGLEELFLLVRQPAPGGARCRLLPVEANRGEDRVEGAPKEHVMTGVLDQGGPQRRSHPPA